MAFLHSDALLQTDAAIGHRDTESDIIRDLTRDRQSAHDLIQTKAGIIASADMTRSPDDIGSREDFGVNDHQHS